MDSSQYRCFQVWSFLLSRFPACTISPAKTLTAVLATELTEAGPEGFSWLWSAHADVCCSSESSSGAIPGAASPSSPPIAACNELTHSVTMLWSVEPNLYSNPPASTSTRVARAPTGPWVSLAP